jgi:hypothetical protein
MHVRQPAYDSQTLAMMSRAYDSAINDLKHADVPVCEKVKAAVATRILADVDDGERDPNKLSQCALEAASYVKAIIGASKGLEAFRRATPSGSTSLRH